MIWLPFAGESDGKQATDVKEAAISTEVTGGEGQLTVEEEKKDGEEQEPAVAPAESSSS